MEERICSQLQRKHLFPPAGKRDWKSWLLAEEWAKKEKWLMKNARVNLKCNKEGSVNNLWAAAAGEKQSAGSGAFTIGKRDESAQGEESKRKETVDVKQTSTSQRRGEGWREGKNRGIKVASKRRREKKRTLRGQQRTSWHFKFRWM